MVATAGTITGWEVLLFASPLIMNTAILCIMLCIHYSSRKPRVSQPTLPLASPNSVPEGISAESFSQGCAFKDLMCAMRAEHGKELEPGITQTFLANPPFPLAETLTNNTCMSPRNALGSNPPDGLSHGGTLSTTARPFQNQSGWPIAANGSQQGTPSPSLLFTNSVVARTEPFPLLHSPIQESGAFYLNENSRSSHVQSTDINPDLTRINRSKTNGTLSGSAMQPSSPRKSRDWWIP